LLLAGLLHLPSAVAVSFQSTDDFVRAAFGADAPSRVLYLGEAEQQKANEILGHRYPALRLRYWQAGARTAWVLDELGKERPITIGVVVDGDAIADVRILAYREPRGGEVRHPYFLDQFLGLTLQADGKLSGRVDGISGATLSVRAVTGISRYAVFLHRSVVGVAANGVPMETRDASPTVAQPVVHADPRGRDPDAHEEASAAPRPSADPER